jgi:hypothetical protein
MHPARILSHFVLLAALLAVACVPPTFPEDKLPTYEERPVYGNFNADFQSVWDASLQVMSDRYPVSRVDRERGIISTEWVHGTSDYIHNTFAGTRIPEKIRFRVLMEIRNRSGRVEVRLVIHEQVEKDIISANLEFTGAIYEWIDVPSSTRKERQILEDVLDILEGRVMSTGPSYYLD